MTVSLLALSRAASEEAKDALRKRTWAHVATGIITLVSYSLPPTASHVFVMVAILTEMAAWYYRRRAQGRHMCAEHLRRSALLMNAYGRKDEPIEAIDARACLPKAVERRAVELEDANYYASTLPAGPERLVETLQESAFYSKHLCRAAARRLFVVTGALIVGILIAIGLVLPSLDGPAITIVARIVIVFLMVLITADVCGEALDWHDSAAVAERVDRVLEQQTVPIEQELLAIFADYSVATAGALPIPTDLYMKQRDQLDEKWRNYRRHATKSPGE